MDCTSYTLYPSVCYTQNMTQEEVLQVALEYKLALKEARVPFHSVILFGSAARDEMHPESDIDIAVVGTSFKKDHMQEMHELWRLRRPISYKLQPIWLYPEHLEDKYSTLAMEIKKDGIIVDSATSS